MLFEDLTGVEVLKSIMRLETDSRPLDLEMMSVLKDMYDNTSKPIRPPDMSTRIYRGRVENWTPVNYTAMVVDKIASVLYGRPITRDSGDESINKVLAQAYQANRNSFLRISKMASLCGYGAIRIRRFWDGTIGLSTYGFSDVTPLFDPDNDFGSPDGIVFDVLVDTLPEWALSQVKRKSVYQFKEVITRNKRDERGNIIKLGSYRAFVDNKEINTPSNGINPLGDYLGAVYWRGLDHPFNPWGKSDILPIYNTLVAINELFTDGRELMTWGIHSPVIVTNANGQVNWQYSPRSILRVDGEGVDVKRLESATQSYRDFQSFIEMLLAQFHNTARIPSVAVGDLNGIGKASSGRAFEIAMIPMTELMDEKESVCIPQELELMAEIIAKKAYYGDITGYTTPIDGFTMPDIIKINKLLENAKVEFSPITYPEVVNAETLTAQVQGGIRSRENAIKTLHEDWTDQQIEDELKIIDADKTIETDAMAENTISALREKLGAK